MPRVIVNIVLALLVVIMSSVAAHAQTTDIKVLSDSPLEPALRKVADLFRQDTNIQVNMVFDPSPDVKKRIDGGEAADVVIVQPDFADDLAREGKVNAGSRPIIGHVGVGLGNRRDSPADDISSPEKLKQTLLGADTIVFNSVPSGNTFGAALEKLGIAETLKPKIVRTTPNGIFEPVLKGKGNDFVAGTMPLIATTTGIKLLGPLPGDLQKSLTYTAVLMTNASQPDAGERFINFLSSPRAKETFTANGVN